MSSIKEHYLYAGEVFVHIEPHLVSTVLGSCVAVCLHDPILKIGGINHYKLPLWNGSGLASPNYGNIAIDKLIRKISLLGSEMGNLIAKVFGGAAVFAIAHDTLGIGEKNITIAMDLLDEMKIPIISSSLGGNFGRRLNFNTQTGEVFMRMLKNSNLNSGEEC